MMYQRLNSPYLPDHEYSDYLIQQYQDILDVCNATQNMPELVIRVPPKYATASPPPLNVNGSADNCCTGQTIVKSTLDPKSSCNSIAQAFNVATGDVQAATGKSDCTLSTSSICLSSPCVLHQIPADATCNSLATSFSTIELNVTTISFLSWNPNINGLCDSLPAGDYVCASAPGGSYIPPQPPPGTANANGQQRGGNDGSSAGTPDNTTLGSTTVTGSSPASAPSPTQTGITARCTRFVQRRVETTASSSHRTMTSLRISSMHGIWSWGLAVLIATLCSYWDITTAWPRIDSTCVGSQFLPPHISDFLELRRVFTYGSKQPRNDRNTTMIKTFALK